MACIGQRVWQLGIAEFGIASLDRVRGCEALGQAVSNAGPMHRMSFDDDIEIGEGWMEIWPKQIVFKTLGIDKDENA